MPSYTRRMTTYSGGCHCGKVRFEAEAELTQVLECNCSHCSMKGLLLAFIPASSFTLRMGEDALTLYQFNKKHIDHLFCSSCGVQSFGRGKDKEGNQMIALNARCLDGVDPSTLSKMPFDGKGLM